MDIREGNRVRVNLAPFIGARVRSKQSVSCVVTAVEEARIQVTTGYPYRSVTLWIAPRWIESEDTNPIEEAFAESAS
jgi:hypothetical protein